MISSASAGCPGMPARVDALALVHRAALREVVILGVLHDGQVERAPVLERAAHEARVHDAASVVAEGHDAGLLELADVRERARRRGPREMAPMG